MLKATLQLMPDGLLCALLNEEPRAGDCLFERHIGPVTGYLEQQFKGIDCDVIAQEALLRCLTVAMLQGVKHFRSYVYTAAIRLALKAKAHALRFEEVSLDAFQRDRISTPALVSEDIAIEQIEQVWMQQAGPLLKEAMRELSPKVRDACILFYIAGKTIAEIAHQLKVSKGAIKDRLDEGRKKMRANPRVISFCQENGEEACK